MSDYDNDDFEVQHVADAPKAPSKESKAEHKPNQLAETKEAELVHTGSLTRCVKKRMRSSHTHATNCQVQS